MNEMIKISRQTASFTPNLSLLVAIVVSLTISHPAAAHGPGLDEIDAITTQIVEMGEPAGLYAKRAHVYQNNHMWQEAMSDLDRAAELDSQNTEYDLDRAELSLEAGEFLRALDFIDLYLLRHEGSHEALLIRARSHRALGQYPQSIESYQSALADLSGSEGSPMPEWYIEFADTWLLAGNKRNALQVLRKGIDHLGMLGVFQLRAAELEVELGLYDSALARVDQLLARAQRKDLWLTRRADILTRAGREEEALQTYEQAYAALQSLPPRLQNLPVSIELENRLLQQINQQ
ncbi:MAG: tetratricopeptide repeat protein [Gammaproteobacteria bacterium]|nr:tetratricopeptide repeat protein [Gammaproteobacteria bacterium]